MENDSTDFLRRLEEAIALRGKWLETVRIPLLKDAVGTYRSLFEGIVATLSKKGLLREDPYAYEGKVSAIVAPPDTALSETGDDTEVGRRIAAYRRQLEFLLNGLPSTLASMDLVALKGISSLLSYVDWEGFGERSHSPTTRALARLVIGVRLSKDGLSSRALQESQEHIGKLARDIRERVAEMEAWHRESWKAQVRAKVLPLVSSHAPKTGDERATKALLIKKAFEQALPEGTWHPQFVQEILGEDQPPGSAERLEKLLVSLAVPRPTISKPDDAPRRRTALLEAVRGVCSAAQEIGQCEEALLENERAVQNRRLGVFQRIKQWFQKKMGRLDNPVYDIEYRPSPTAELKTESIDFLRFVSEMKELSVVLVEITEAGSPGHRRVEAMEEVELCDFFGWLLRQLRQLHDRMEGLNALFHVKAVRDQGGTVRSIKLELLAIENGMIRADAARHENMACRETLDSKS
jgi:hypothetical protein